MSSRCQKVENFCNHAVVWAFYASIFFLPISIALVESFFFIIILFYAVKKIAVAIRLGHIKEFLPYAGFLNTPMVINAAAVFISVVLSHYLGLSFFAFMGKFLKGYLLFCAFVECLTQTKHFRRFVFVFMLSGTIISLSGISQVFTHKDFVRGNIINDGRVTSSLRHPNDFGAYLIIILIFALVLANQKILFNSKNQLWRGGLYLLVFISTVCLGLTYSRGTWIGFVLAMIIYGFWAHRKKFCLIFVVFFMAIFIPLMVYARNVSFLSDDIRSDHRLAETMEQSESNSQIASPAQKTFYGKTIENMDVQFQVLLQRGIGTGRLGFWHEAVNVIRSAPVFGTGLNTYSRIAPNYKISWGGYPHNCYLQMAAEVGLVGLVTFLVLIFCLFREVVLYIPHAQDPFLQTLMIAGVVGLSGFLLQSFFDTTLYSVQLGNLMWLVMGLTAAAIEADRKLTKQKASL